MSDSTPAEFSGIVEVDETYVGGKPRKVTKGRREKAEAEGRTIPKNKRGRGTKKIPIVVLVERGGRVRASPVASVTSFNLHSAILHTTARGPRGS
jgi:hypothetical protein